MKNYSLSFLCYVNLYGIFHHTNHSKHERKHTRHQIAKTILRKKGKTVNIDSLWFQTILQSYDNQNSMVLAQKLTYRSMKQDRKIRNKPTHFCEQLIYNNGGKNKQQEKESLYNKWFWENFTAICKRIKLDWFLAP